MLWLQRYLTDAEQVMKLLLKAHSWGAAYPEVSAAAPAAAAGCALLDANTAAEALLGQRMRTHRVRLSCRTRRRDVLGSARLDITEH
jgi:hypothetical protein